MSEVYFDKYLDWCEKNMDKIVALGDAFFALDIEQGIVFNGNSNDFTAWLAEQSQEYRENLFVSHTYPFLYPRPPHYIFPAD